VIEIFKEFSFDAAHELAQNVPTAHRYAGIHGHSFSVEIHLRGEPDPKTRWVTDFASVDAAIAPVRETLDHAYLNRIEGLELPTLETLSRWIFERLKPSLPLLHRVVIRRGSRGEGCVYQP
jgi:6-pyruvoyltetrahydropterin/6-carboxytetrahydropterin synthase